MKKIIKEEKSWQLKVMEYITYGAIFIIPLYFSMKHWFPFSAPKAILINIFVFVLVVLYGWWLYKEKKQNILFKINPLQIALFIFLSILTLGAILGVDPHNSFFGVWGQSISLSVLFGVSIFACLVGFLINKDKSLIYKLLSASFISSMIFALISYGGEALISLSRGGSTLGNSSFAGAYLLFNVCFGIGLFFYYQKYWQKIVIAIGLITVLFSPIFFNHQIFTGVVSLNQAIRNPLLFIGQANGAVMGLSISILFILCFLLINLSKKWAKIPGFIFLAIISGAVLYTGILFSNPNSNLHNLYIEQKGANRFLFWDIAKDGFLENPVLGNGFNNYIYTFQNYYSNSLFDQNYYVENWTNQPHNIFWEYMSNTGLLGTISFFLLLVLVFITLYKKRDSEDNREHILKIVLSASLIGYLLQNMFVFDTPLVYFMLFTVIGIAIGVSREKKLISMPVGSWVNKIGGISLILLGIGGVIILGVLPWRESRAWQKMSSRKIFDSGFGEISRIQKISPLGGIADIAFFVDKAFANNQNKIIEIVKKNNDFTILKTAEELLEYEIKKQPLNFRSYVTLVRVMIIDMTLSTSIDQDIWQRAENFVLKARELNKKHPDTYLLEGNLAILKGDFEKARMIIREGINLAPQYEESYRIAKEINKIKPDEDFEKYLNEMENKYLNK